MQPKLSATFEMAVTAANVAARTIEGTLVPYGEVGVAAVNGAARKIRYRPGSVALARARTPLVFSHDLDRPIGVLAELEETDDAAVARFTVDPTPDGDAALAQAASGSRGGLSVGAELLEYDDGGEVLDVTASQVFHVGLVTVPAFPSAEVTSVTAANPEREEAMDPKKIRELLGLAESATDEEVEAKLKSMSDAEAEAAKKAAEESATTEQKVEHERPVILARREEEKPLKPGAAGELVKAMILAARGDQQAIKVVEAALSVIDSTDVPGLMPKQYVGSVLGAITTDRALANRVAVRRPMPATGMEFTKPKWTTLPNGGWVAENADIPSNAPAIGTQDVSILEWAYGVAMSYAVATRSSPDAIESIFRAAVEDYYADCEQKIADLLMASDTPTAAGASLGAAVAGYYSGAQRTAGPPDLLVVSADVYGDLFDALIMVPAVQGATGVDAGFRGTIGGLEVVVSPFLPDGTEIVTSRGVVEFRESEPVRLTANVIGALQVELGVTAFASFDLEKPGAIISLTPAPGSPSGTSQAKRSAGKAKK